MKRFDNCRTCGRWDWLDSHECPPTWLVADPDYEGEIENGKKIHALDACAAVERYAELRTYDGDGLFESDRILVRPAAEDGPAAEYEVTGELVPEFTATRRGD